MTVIMLQMNSHILYLKVNVGVCSGIADNQVVKINNYLTQSFHLNFQTDNCGSFLDDVWL